MTYTPETTPHLHPKNRPNAYYQNPHSGFWVLPKAHRATHTRVPHSEAYQELIARRTMEINTLVALTSRTMKLDRYLFPLL
jgi:hypothetical protein